MFKYKSKLKLLKQIVRNKNPGNVKLTLYQYVTCPFCCKVRAYLDYYGYTYDIVEVNSISKKQINWSGYKKVPIVAVQFPSKENPNEYEKEIIVNIKTIQCVKIIRFFKMNFSNSMTPR